MASGNVTVMALPTVQLAATYHGHSSPLTNVSLSFTSTVRLGVPPYRYSWSYSDGTISTRPDSNHSFADPGPASVRLTVTDAVGGVGIATLNFNVSSPTSGSSSLLVPLVIVGVVVAVILVAVAAIVILRRRRRPVAPWHSEPAMPPLAPPPPPPSA
jgi:PKD repeat protein